MKKLWSGIKSIVNLRNKSNNISQLISENGDIIKDVRGWQFLTMKAAETLCTVC